MKPPLLTRSLFTPGGLIRCAIILTAFFLVCRAAGWREYAAILCGGDPSGGGAGLPALLGLLYVLTFVAVTAGAPILVLASGFLWLLNRGNPEEDSPCGSN